jgi:hypothetical protein
MTWNGLTAGGHKAAAAAQAQDAFDAHQAVANQQNRQPEIDYTAPAPVAPHGDGLHLDGGFEQGPCRCGWRRDGRLHLARRNDGSVLDGNTCPKCGKALYQ